MLRTVFLKISGCICFVLLIVACHSKKEELALPYYNTPDFTPVWNTDTLKHPLHIIPAFAFTDQNNQAVTEKTFDNKIYVANFFFTTCGAVCPIMTNNLLKVEKTFPGNDSIAFISHSVTPWIDSTQRLKAFSQKYDLDPRWHLVTGDKATIYKLARQSYFAEEELGFAKDSSEFLHSEHVLLIDKDKHIRGIYNGTLELEMDRLIADIRTLLNDQINKL